RLADRLRGRLDRPDLGSGHHVRQGRRPDRRQGTHRYRAGAAVVVRAPDLVGHRGDRGPRAGRDGTAVRRDPSRGHRGELGRQGQDAAADPGDLLVPVAVPGRAELHRRVRDVRRRDRHPGHRGGLRGPRVPAAPGGPVNPAQAVLDLLRGRGQTLAVAESLTGGLLAATIVDVPGASHAFRGGFVVYATDLKATLA